MAKIAVIGLSGESIFMKVPSLPTPSTTIHATSCHKEPGGKGYNMAVALKKLGCDVSYLTKVGNDESGKYCEKYLQNLGVVTYFTKSKKYETPLATILTNIEGENEVIVYGRAASDLNDDDLTLFEKEIKEASYLILQYELSLDIIKKAIKIAHQYQTKVILNPAPARFDDEVLQEADIVTPNFEEAKTLYHLDPNTKKEDLAFKLKNQISNTLIVTLGKDGALLIENNQTKYYPPLEVKAVDTTGAGDIFNAALAFALASDETLDDAIKYAIVVSALSVTKPYVMDAILSNAEICKFLQLYNLKQKS